MSGVQVTVHVLLEQLSVAVAGGQVGAECRPPLRVALSLS